jgi:hypothetical protein
MAVNAGVGCTNHTVMVYDRGGFTRLFQLEDVISVQWQRVRDDISLADITISSPGPACLRMLEQIEPGRHELVVYRGTQRVWEGPITLLVEEQGLTPTVKIQARDVMHYAYRLIMRRRYNNAYPHISTTVDRAAKILRTELARREREDPPINVLPHLQVIRSRGMAKTSRITKAYQSTVFEDIDSLASYSGLDYTVIGRRIVLFDRHIAIGRTPTVTQADFLGDVRITVFGMELATFAAVTGGNGMYAVAGGADDYYGNWEVLDSAYDEEQDSAKPTQAELSEQARRNLVGHMPSPVQIRVPDNARINPNGVLTMDNLVPGIQVPVRAKLAIRQVQQYQKLNKVQVNDDAAGERIQIILVPSTGNPVVDEAGVTL